MINRVLFFIFIIVVPFLGCYGRKEKYVHQSIDRSSSSKDIAPYRNLSTNNICHIQEPTAALPKKLAIVLAHGFGMTPEYVAYLGEQLREKEYKDYSTPKIILLCSSAGNLSLNSIPEQAYQAIKEIEKALKNEAPTSIVLIGHSQGTLRIEKIKEIITTMESFTHQIVSIIHISGLFKGVPILDTSLNAFNRFVEEGEKGLRKISINNVDIGKSWKEKWLFLFYLPIMRWWNQGVADMRPESRLLREITNFIENDLTPRLFIAGSTTDWNLLFGTENDPDITNCERAYSKWITGSEDGDHDTLIPRDSQLGDHLQNSWIERIVIPNIVHATDIVPLLPFEKLPSFKQKTDVVEEVYSPEVIEKIHDFINKQDVQ